MFAGFNFEVTGYDFSRLKKLGENLFYNQKTQVEETLDEFMLEDGIIDGTKMQGNWFPKIRADVFISHSHNDQDLAIGLAGLFKEVFGLTSFIDSCVWGYANDLLRKIDDTYCRNTQGATYNYDKRNYSTSHVHMMLATALTMMIDETECVFFINSPNSITSKDVINNRTMSPWIYHELGMTRMVRKKSPEFHREKMLKSKAAFTEDSIQKSLNISYVANMDHLHRLDDEDIAEWLTDRDSDKSTHALDHLYKIKQITPTPLLETFYG